MIGGVTTRRRGCTAAEAALGVGTSAEDVLELLSEEELLGGGCSARQYTKGVRAHRT